MTKSDPDRTDPVINTVPPADAFREEPPPWSSRPGSGENAIDEANRGIAEAFREVMREEVRNELKPVRHLMGVLTTQVTANHVRLGRRVSVLEATRIAPVMMALALSLAAFGIMVAGGTAQAQPVCPPAAGGSP